MCNYWANRLVCEAADRAMQVHGGIGYSRHKPFEHIYRHHRRYRITEGLKDPDAQGGRLPLFGYMGPEPVLTRPTRPLRALPGQRAKNGAVSNTRWRSAAVERQAALSTKSNISALWWAQLPQQLHPVGGQQAARRQTCAGRSAAPRRAAGSPSR